MKNESCSCTKINTLLYSEFDAVFEYVTVFEKHRGQKNDLIDTHPLEYVINVFAETMELFIGFKRHALSFYMESKDRLKGRYYRNERIESGYRGTLQY